MKAEWNDAPIRIRNKHSHRPFLAAMVSVIGLAVLGTYVTGVLPAVVKSLEHKDQRVTKQGGVRPAASDSEPTAAPDSKEDPYLEQVNRMLGITSDYVAEPAAEIEWATERQRSTEQQNVFTDANYTPATTVNTVRMPTPRPQPAQPQQRQQPYVTVVKETKLSCAPFKEGSMECRRHKARVHQMHRRNCDTSGNSQSTSCRMANRYDLR